MTPPIDKLTQLRTELISIIDKFSLDKREQKLFDDWSLKDVLAHLAGWDEIAVNALKNLIVGQLSEWSLGVDSQNKKSVETRINQSWLEVYSEFVTNSQKLIDSYFSLADDLWDKPLYYGKKFSAAKFLNTDIRHYTEHLEKIKESL